MAITYLSPGTAVTLLPSLRTHETEGVGLPCAKQDKCVPESLLNTIYAGGSWINVGTLWAVITRTSVSKTIKLLNRVSGKPEKKKKSNCFSL